MKKKAATALIVLIIAGLSLIGGIVYAGVADKVRRQKYPREYMTEVSSSAAEFGIPEETVYAVLKVTSGFTPAYDEDGKAGIYPITEAKYATLAEGAGESGDARLRFNPGVSIRLCAYELSIYLREYGDRETAFAAIFAGKDATDKNLSENDGTLNIDKFDKDTKKLIEKATKAYEKYVSLYTEQE